MKETIYRHRSGEYLLPLNLQTFAEGGDDNGAGEGGQGAAGEGAAATGGQGSSAGKSGDGQSGQSGEGQKQEPPKTFTQDELNAIAAKEAKKAQEKMLKDLGITDFNSAKDGLAKLKEWQESQKTEAEKTAERLKQLETENQTALSERETLQAQVAAMKAGVVTDSVEDVVTLAKPLVNDETDMSAAISKVLEKYPHFKAQAQQSSGDEKKPQFTNGEHKKQPQSTMDKWLEAFKN